MAGLALSVAALASSVAPAKTTPDRTASPHTMPSKHASTTSTAHSSGAHKTTHKSSKASARQKTSSRGKKGSRNLRSSRKRGQQVIDPERARAIQEALIREHYLDGEPSGRWDSATQAAMQRYQADQGWQSKTTPDSRALIKLGLGPSKDHLLNPESAMTTADPKPQAQQPSPTASTPPQ